jgi:hypothetical protein
VTDVPGNTHPATPTISPVGVYTAFIHFICGRRNEGLSRVARRLARVATSASRSAGGSILSQKASGKQV